LVPERPLRILQVSTYDIHGGAAKVAWNLFAAYRARGHASWLAVGEKRSEDPDVLLIPNQALRGRWYHFWHQAGSRLHPTSSSPPAARLLRRLINGLAEPARRIDVFRGVEDFHFPGTRGLLTLTSQRPDLVHCHNLHGGYFDLRLLPWLSQQLPVILTLHDAWLLSGHCAHSFSCERWKTGCGRCPDLTIYPAIQRDATAGNWRRKQDIYARSRLFIATPSRWLMSKVEQSMLAPAVANARVLPNGVDLGIFRPADRRAARALRGIPDNALVLLTTGVMIQRNVWKDYPTLRRAIALVARRLPKQELLFLALGDDAPPERADRVEVRFVPYQDDPSIVAQYYQAADVYVHAARADTFPSSVLEALACGTPVVATRVGGIPEQVEDGRTGFLVSPGDAHDLAEKVVQIVTDSELRENIARRAAETARRRYSFERQVDAYLQWYHEVINEKGKV
jgi:glycosyltransferase involved in cell wall biosynthesis